MSGGVWFLIGTAFVLWTLTVLMLDDGDVWDDD